ncbi:hypothetical protein ACIQUQ_10400 [Streptomyces sp. NPDC101118]|uniref:hypothetical protein n=1 Tax=Streptomyces sp. NPDC101118 TaxID=3366109 RepID=UPI00381CB5D8
MPFDPFAALNAMLRAEAARSTPRPQDPAGTGPEPEPRPATGTRRDPVKRGSTPQD